MIKRVYSYICSTKPRLYVFGGQGTHQKGMLSELLKIQAAREQIKNYSKLLNIDFQYITTNDENKLINSTKITQPLLVLTQVLIYKYMNQRKVREEDFMIGHSVGEYSALCVAESVGIEECLKLVKRRGELMEEFTGEASGMLTIRYSDDNTDKVNTCISDLGLQIACFNTQNNISVAGPLVKLKLLASQLKKNNITCLLLPVSASFHCYLLTGMIKHYRSELQKINFVKPKANILRNLDGQIYHDGQHIKFGLLKHLTHPVKFYQSILKIDKDIQCIQIGHKQNIKKFVIEIRNKIKK